MATDPLTLLNGTTADANEVETKFFPLYNELDPSNVEPTRLLGPASGDFISDELGGNVILAGNYTFNGTVNLAGIISLILPNATPTLTREMGSSGGILQVHDGTAARTYATLETAQTFIAEKTFNAEIQAPAGIDMASTGQQLIMDSSAGITSIFAVGALGIQFRIAGGDNSSIEASGEMFLADVDPPAANRINRNSGVKIWGNINAGVPSFFNEYNMVSITNPGTGVYNLTIDTDFSDQNTSFVGNVVNFSGIVTITNFGTGVIIVNVRNSTTGANTNNDFTFMACGDQ